MRRGWRRIGRTSVRWRTPGSPGPRLRPDCGHRARIAPHASWTGGAGGDLQQLASLFTRLDRIARAAGVTHVSEQRAYAPWAEEVKKLLDAARR